MSASQPLLPKTHPKPTPQQLSKSRAIRTKLRTYECLLALQNGYVPTTAQFTAHLNWLLRSSGILEPRNRRLSVRGRNTIRDVRAWIEAVAEEADAKNGGDEIQEFFWELSKADIDFDAPSMPVSARTVKRDSKKALQQLRTLGELIYSNSEFRKLLSDANILFRDIFSDVASKAAEQASEMAQTSAQMAGDAEDERPSQGDLDGVDDPANEGQQKGKEPPSGEDVKKQAKKAGKQAKKEGEEVKRQLTKKGKKSKDDIQQYLNQKFPKQRQDAVINRLKKMITDIQKDPDYVDAINFLLDLLAKYTSKAKELADNTGEQVEDADPNKHLENAIALGHHILTNFASGHDLSGIQSSLQSLLEQIRSDKTIEQFFHDVNRFVQRALKEEGYVISDAADQKAHELLERGRELTAENEEYKESVEDVGDEIEGLFEAVRDDRGNRRVVLAGKKVFEDLTVEDGRLDVWRDFLDVVLPTAVSKVVYVPVPRIEYQDADIDLVVENLVFEADNFLPSRIRVDVRSHAEFTSAYTFESEYGNSTTVKIDEFRVRAKDISYAFRKKTGFLQFEDKGLIDIYLDRKGVSAEIKLTANATTSPSEESFFQVDKVDVNIRHFSYSLQQSEHNILAFLLYPFVKTIIRHQLERLLEREIKSQFETVDSWFRDVRARMRVAKGLGPETWVKALLQAGSAGRGRGGQYMVNIGGEELLRGFRGPIGEEMVRGEMRAEEGRGWKNKIFDLQQ